MRKFLLITTLIVLLSPFLVLAADNPVDINEYTKNVGSVGGYTTEGVNDTTLAESVGRVIKIALSLTGVIFLALTVYAGILWMTAQGNAENVEKAQGIVKSASFGLLIIVSCYGLVVFVIAAIGAVTNTRNTNVGPMSAGPSFWGNFGKNFKNSWWKNLSY